MKPTFGDKEEIADMKKRKRRQTKIPVGNCKIRTAFKFKLCRKCAKNVDKGVYQISTVFQKICDEDKKKILKIANKKFVIGGGIKIVSHTP